MKQKNLLKRVTGFTKVNKRLMHVIVKFSADALLHHLRRHCALPSFFSPSLPLLPQTCQIVPLVFLSPGCDPPSSAASRLLSVVIDPTLHQQALAPEQEQLLAVFLLRSAPEALPLGCSEEEVQKEVVVHG